MVHDIATDGLTSISATPGLANDSGVLHLPLTSWNRGTHVTIRGGSGHVFGQTLSEVNVHFPCVASLEEDTEEAIAQLNAAKSAVLVTLEDIRRHRQAQACLESVPPRGLELPGWSGCRCEQA